MTSANISEQRQPPLYVVPPSCPRPDHGLMRACYLRFPSLPSLAPTTAPSEFFLQTQMPSTPLTARSMLGGGFAGTTETMPPRLHSVLESLVCQALPPALLPAAPPDFVAPHCLDRRGGCPELGRHTVGQVARLLRCVHAVAPGGDRGTRGALVTTAPGRPHWAARAVALQRPAVLPVWHSCGKARRQGRLRS